jgi:tetratricopeptide (TPR) repeat protein
MTTAATAANAQVQPPGGTDSPWIYRPWLDLLIGAGGWSAPLLLLAYPLSISGTQVVSTAFYALALVFNNPHYMATVYRAYGSQEDRRKYRFFTLYVTAFLVLAGVLIHFYSQWLPWLFTLYITWSPWHYAGQNYGLMMMFVRRGKVAPSPAARHALYGAFIASYLMLFLSFHARPSLDPMVLSLGLPEHAGDIGRVALGVIFAVLGSYGLASIVRQASSSWRNLIAPLTLFATQCLWFVLPSVLELGYGVRLPQTRYSTGILALMHSAQYLWITSYYARRESEAKGLPWRGWAYFAALVVGGIALFVPGPWLVSYLFHYDFSSSFLIFVSLINIHHFVLDGAIWKLRDGRIASLLLGSRDQVAAAAKKTLAGISQRLSTPWFKRMRTAAAIVLLVWAGLDQLKYHLAQGGHGVDRMVQVASLNPYDATVLRGLAESEMQAGNSGESLAVLRRAANLAGSNPEVRMRFIAALLEARLFDEAYAQNLRLLAGHDADANWMVNFGLAAQQLGHLAEARESWTKAMEAYPRSAAPALCLAQSFLREGRPADAARYYDKFVQLVVEYPRLNRPDGAGMAGILLQSAQTHAQINQTRLALQQYGEALHLATLANHQPLQAAVYSSMADLQARVGDASGALRSYQSALKLDAGEPALKAADWFNYGQFLEKQKYPSQFAYACIRKAEALLLAAHSPDLASVSKSRLAMEKQLGKRLPQADQDYETLAVQAASLAPMSN